MREVDEISLSASSTEKEEMMVNCGVPPPPPPLQLDVFSCRKLPFGLSDYREVNP